MSSRRFLVATLSFVLGAAALATAPSAVAGGDQIRRDDCGGASTVRLRVIDTNNGGLSVIGAVFSDDEDVWDWRMKHNGDTSAEGDVRARDADRSLRIERSMFNLFGTDQIVFRAENRRTGEVCREELSF